MNRRLMIAVCLALLMLIIPALVSCAAAPAPNAPRPFAPAPDSRVDMAWDALPAVDAEQAALGRLLFYDPILSGSNNLSCATCHHPDLGFADGLALSRGAHDQDLRRSSPSLWNVAFASTFFWDGRADSLEDQMLEPLTNAEEMGANLDDLLAELRANAEYESLFDAQFSDGITLDNIVTAIAAFERTLVSQNAPFDRFAAGDFYALTPSQRRGFDLFQSDSLRCDECHELPTFRHEDFHVLGVPDADRAQPDLGRVEITGLPADERAFRVPTLRNVTLTAPYMHNGDLRTLDDVIMFYEDGGNGPGIRVRIDHRLSGFRLTDQQNADLIAFLYALTDEPSSLTAIPESVPSGLPLVQPINNPTRALVEAALAPPYDPNAPHTPQTITVHTGELLQAGVDRALPGDTVLVEPGAYYETITVDVSDITIRGLVSGDERPWLYGQDIRGYAFVIDADNVTLEGMGVRNFVRSAVRALREDTLTVSDLLVEDMRG